MKEVVFRPCHPEHIKYINPQDHDRLVQQFYTRPEYLHVIEDNFAVSAWVGLKCIGAAGIAACEDGSSLAWSIIGRDAGPYMRALVRKIKKALELHPSDVFMTVSKDFIQGCKLAEMLGFVLFKPHNNELVYRRPKRG